MMQEKKYLRRGILRYSKRAERIFFFYATMAMFVYYGILKILER